MKIFYYGLIFFFIALIIIYLIQLKEQREYFKCNLDDNKGSHSCFKEKQNDNKVKIKEASKKNSKLTNLVAKMKKDVEKNKKESKKITDYLNTVEEEGKVEKE